MNKDTNKVQKNDKRPLVFLGVGIFNTLVDFLFYTFLTQVVLTKPGQIGLAGIISGTFALLCAFATHNFITWHERPADRQTLLRFFAFTGFGMWVIRPLLLSLFVHFGELYRWFYDLLQSAHLVFSYDFIAKTGAFGFMVILVLIYNYLVYDRFVFMEKSK